MKRRDLDHALPLYHLLDVLCQAIDDAVDESLSLLGGCHCRIRIWLIANGFRAHVFGKGGKGKGGLELLGMARQIGFRPAYWPLE